MELEQATALDFTQIKVRCSAISKIMAYPDQNKLPVGAMTYAEEIVDSTLFSFSTEVTSKQMEKGHIVELQSIQQLNSLKFTNYEKAELPNSNEFLTTESCDILVPEFEVIDIKSPWTKKTFPKTIEKAKKMAKSAGYPDQMQGYMSIYQVPKARVAFCLQDTPEELCEWEDPTLHFMDDVPEELKVTIVEYEHSETRQQQIYGRVVLLRAYAQKYYLQILQDHGLKYTG